VRLLTVTNLTKNFGGLTAINNINFSMDKGQIVSVIGPNGAGKTTFFNMISGYYAPDSGTIEFDGRSLTRLSPERVAQQGIARTFQNIRLFKDMLVAENVLVGRYMRMRAGIWDCVLRLPRMRQEEREAYEKVLELLDYVGLSGKEGELAKNLSYGQQRRLDSGQAGERVALLHDPPSDDQRPRAQRADVGPGLLQRALAEQRAPGELQ